MTSDKYLAFRKSHRRTIDFSLLAFELISEISSGISSLLNFFLAPTLKF